MPAMSTLKGAELEEEVIHVGDEEDGQKEGALRHFHGWVAEDLG